MKRAVAALAIPLIACASCSNAPEPAPPSSSSATTPVGTVRDQDPVERDINALAEEIRQAIEHISPDVGWDDTPVGPRSTSCGDDPSSLATEFQSNVFKTSHTPDAQEWPQWTDAVTRVAGDHGFRVDGEVPDHASQNRYRYNNGPGDVLRVSSSETSGFVFDVQSSCVPGNAARA